MNEIKKFIESNEWNSLLLSIILTDSFDKFRGIVEGKGNMENLEKVLENCSCELRVPEEKRIKMCPFCGGEPETHEEHTDNGGVEVYYKEYHYYTVMCKKCGARITDCYGMDRAISQWNSRV